MKKWITRTVGIALVAGLGIVIGCDWSTGEDGHNTSRTGTSWINFTGVYNGNVGGAGMKAGGVAVASTSGGQITQLTIHHSGNAVEVTDNQGSTYRGSVGSPGAVANPDEDGIYPVGAQVTQAQISWSGKDEVAGKNVEFVGVIHVVAVTDIIGNKSSTEVTDKVEDETTTTYTDIVGGKTNVVTVIVTPVPGGTITTTITVDGETGQEISREVVETETEEETASTSQEFQLTEANGQYRLEGTWIEEDGVTARVSALSSGASGIIVVVGAEVEE